MILVISLATFRFVRQHAINLLSGIYLAAALAHLIGKLMPRAQAWAFFFFPYCGSLPALP